nr:hypothetical protein [Desulfitobacterium dichloroeliminans]
MASALGYLALQKGYTVSFLCLDELIKILKTAEITASSRRKLIFDQWLFLCLGTS